jgi:prepilin-type N-terminal cleavage/methylation domain-containing protein
MYNHAGADRIRSFYFARHAPDLFPCNSPRLSLEYFLRNMSRQVRTNRGFTLIELLVVMAILGLVMGVVIQNHSRFGGKILLRTLTFDAALTIRQAQVYGISVRQSATGSTGFNAPYGVHFELATPTAFKLFADTSIVGSDNGTFTLGADTTIQTYSIGRGYKLNKICTTSVGSSTEDCTTPTSIDLVFRRPEPDAEIRQNGVNNVLYPKVRIEMKSPRGDLQSIVVEVSGQISII